MVEKAEAIGSLHREVLVSEVLRGTCHRGTCRRGTCLVMNFTGLSLPHVEGLVSVIFSNNARVCLSIF